MKWILLLISPILLVLFPSLTFAQEDKFDIRYDVNYLVSENGITSVTQNISLKNKTDDYRPSEYSLELGLIELKNIQASDSLGPLTPKIEKKDGKTRITLIFNQVVVGKDKILPFEISFQTQELTKKKGLIWEVDIPGLEDKTNLGEYNVSLTVPEGFGKPAFIKPNKALEDGRLIWTKDEIYKGGTVVAFGEFQIYNFNLKYHLKNPRLYPVQTEIALPPQTNYQKILIKEINPKPLNVRIDEDGNWLASFQLSPVSSLDIEVKGTAQVFLTPQNFIPREPNNNGQQFLEQGSQRQSLYLSPQKYWEVNDKNIKELADSLKTPLDIYNFVVRELTYDLKRVEGGLERVGAAGVLKNKNSAICMEFTDLFIALARAAGIPAREVNGFAWAENSSLKPLSLVKDILHAWPEYYDQKKEKWVMIDPTWGNTTGGLDYFNVLDFDHLAFVIKGKSSEYPIPAGGYKTSTTHEAKDVEVSFGTMEDISPYQDSKINLVIPKKVLPFFPIRGNLIVENKGNILLFPQTIKLSTSDLIPSTQYFTTQNLPPLGKQIIPVNFAKTSLFENKKALFASKNVIILQELMSRIYSANIIYLEGTGVSRDFEILISPFAIFDQKSFFVLGGLSGIAIIIFSAWKIRRLYLPRQQKRDSVRGQGKQSQSASRKLL